MSIPLNNAGTPEMIEKSAADAMVNTVTAFQKQLDKLHTGRATPALLENVHVPQPQGGNMLLGHVATITVIDAQTLMVTPWDKALLQATEKAILASTLGLNPARQGDALRVPLPPLSAQRRQDIARMISTMAEDMCTEIRNHRCKANMHFKTLEKDKVISEDDSRRGQGKIQKLTDEHIKRLKGMAAGKEQQVLGG